MKKILLSLLIATTLPACAQWVADGKIISDTENMKSNKLMGAQLILVKDKNEFMKQWDQPQQPQIKTIDKIKTGERLTAIIVFSGCAEVNNKCNLVVIYKLKKPNGSIQPFSEQPVWDKKAVPKGVLMLGKSMITNQADPDDQRGTYTIEADIMDKNSGYTLTLKNKFDVID